MSKALTSSLLGMDLGEFSVLVSEAGEPAYRAKQIMEAVYRHRVESVDEIATLPQVFRERLEHTGVTLGAARIEKKFGSVDGTVRYLITFADGQSVETVWMPEGDGGEAGDGSEAGETAERLADIPGPGTSGAKAEESEPIAALKRCATQNLRSQDRHSQEHASSGRSTICISSQVGCAVDCQFCLTALLGVKRNLTAGEIVGQVCAVLKDQRVSPPEDRINLVFMGMGEPFLNYENFVTIRPKLAISLNASNDALRTRLMPLNKKWNLDMLIAAAREFPLRTREWITFEYVLLGGVNDAPENAREVAELLRGMRCKVNLIALNPGPGIDFTTPSAERVTAFQNILRGAGTPAFVRRPRGRDIYAACGQLKRTVEAATSPEPQVQSISRVQQ